MAQPVWWPRINIHSETTRGMSERQATATQTRQRSLPSAASNVLTTKRENALMNNTNTAVLPFDVRILLSFE